MNPMVFTVVQLVFFLRKTRLDPGENYYERKQLQVFFFRFADLSYCGSLRLIDELWGWCLGFQNQMLEFIKVGLHSISSLIEIEKKIKTNNNMLKYFFFSFASPYVDHLD